MDEKMPLLMIDEDFFEYLEELSYSSPMDVAEFLEAWIDWSKDNCK